MCFQRMSGTYSSVEQKSFVPFSTGEIKKRWDKKLFHRSGLLLPGSRQGIQNIILLLHIFEISVRDSRLIEMISIAHTLSVKPSGIHYRGERRTLLPGFKLQEMLAFVSDVFSVCVYKNDDVRFSLSPRPLLWLQTICIGSVVPAGIMGQLYENSTLERWAEERRVESKWRW